MHIAHQYLNEQESQYKTVTAFMLKSIVIQIFSGLELKFETKGSAVKGAGAPQESEPQYRVFGVSRY